VTAEPDPAFDGVDEHAGALFTFLEAVTGAVTTSFNAARDNWPHLVGTDCTIHVDRAFDVGTARRVVVERDDERFEFEAPNVGEVEAMFAYFADHVFAGRAIEADGTDGVTDVRAIQAVYESDTIGVHVTF